MGKVILICGRLCCGKSTLARKLADERGAVILSCDEVSLSLFPEGLGENHDAMTDRIKCYLLRKAVELLTAGVDVILEWGFWTRAWRDDTKKYFSKRGFECELYYLSPCENEWKMRIEKRNEAIINGNSIDYYVDEGLFQKALSLFEEPQADEGFIRIQ